MQRPASLIMSIQLLRRTLGCQRVARLFQKLGNGHIFVCASQLLSLLVNELRILVLMFNLLPSPSVLTQNTSMKDASTLRLRLRV